MPPTEELENGDIQFQWGKRRGVGSGNKDVKFYDSFIYDDVSYSLYDNVYLFKEDSEPYVGKILKVWEQPGHKRRVKILWFFRPNDIHNYLDGYVLSEKELFLATGDGVGLCNVNPLEAIAGKCSVICTLLDERNLPPSKFAIENSDFVFSRFFDVGSLAVAENSPEIIAGVELKFLLNNPDDLSLDHPVKHEVLDPISCNDAPIIKSPKPQFDALVDGDFAKKKPFAKFKNDNVNNDVKKKVKPIDGSIKPTYDDHEKVEYATKKRKYLSDEDSLDGDSYLVSKVASQSVEPSELKNNSSDVLPLKSNSLTLHRSRWFADMPWKARIEKAHKQGKLLFLDNLDPSFSASEIEELLHEALKIDCTVKLIPQLAFQNSHYGQAYAICNKMNEAQLAVQEIDEKCLILANGRPLGAKFGMLELPPKAAKFPGHLKVEKGRLQPVRVEHRNAVATSHCSQPNTIEYELALEWLLLFEKYQRSKEKLYKKHHGQLRAFISKYSSTKK